jgi:hypothetical protein
LVLSAFSYRCLFSLFNETTTVFVNIAPGGAENKAVLGELIFRELLVVFSFVFFDFPLAPFLVLFLSLSTPPPPHLPPPFLFIEKLQLLASTM